MGWLGEKFENPGFSFAQDDSRILAVFFNTLME